MVSPSLPIAARATRSLSQAIAFALEAVRSFFHSRLKRPTEQQWGVRVSTPCGTFDFGDWSFEPLTGTGGFPPNEPILEIFNKWKDRREPQHALSGSRKLITYCLGRS